jgi:CDP-diacylglycerol---serine O-phosphatidyltransferase
MNGTAFNIPNLLTLSNLFCGCCAALYLLNGMPETAAWFTVASFLFDTLDGIVARAMKISSPLGKELDSLADVISFGFVPGIMLYTLLAQNGVASGHVDFNALPAFILSAFSGLRLAKFNIDTRQTSYFLGLSTPACTMFMMGVTLAAHQNTFGMGDYIQYHKWVVYTMIAVFSVLLVSEIPMFGLKIKSLDLRSNMMLLVFAAIFAAALLFLKLLALSIIVICYIIVSVLFKEKVIAPVA